MELEQPSRWPPPLRLWGPASAADPAPCVLTQSRARAVTPAQGPISSASPAGEQQAHMPPVQPARWGFNDVAETEDLGLKSLLSPWMPPCHGLGRVRKSLPPPPAMTLPCHCRVPCADGQAGPHVPRTYDRASSNLQGLSQPTASSTRCSLSPFGDWMAGDQHTPVPKRLAGHCCQ